MNSRLSQPRITKADRSKKVVQIEFVAALDGHSDEVRCIKVSSDFSIVVSGSADGTCIIWDKNQHKLVRSLDQHNGPIIAVDIHRYTGDIVVLDEEDKKKGGIHLWTINGEKLGSRRCKPKPLSVVFSQVKPGMGRNVICTGHVNGEIKIWTVTSNLQLLRTLQMHQFPITALAIREDNTRLVSGDVNGTCVIHDTTEIK